MDSNCQAVTCKGRWRTGTPRGPKDNSIDIACTEKESSRKNATTASSDRTTE